MKTRFWQRGPVIVGGLAGLALFGLTLQAVSVGTVLEGVRRVGTGFVWIMLLAGVRLAARAAAWTVCAGGPSHLPFRTTLAACVVGEAAGNLTPLGLAASEPVKVLWVRNRLGTIESAATLAVETLVYTVSVTVMLVGGSLACVAAFAPAAGMRAALIGLAGSACVVTLVWVIWQRRSRRPFTVLRAFGSREQDRPWVRAVADWLRRSGEILRGLASREPATLALVSVLEIVFHAVAVAEVSLTLVLLGVPHTTFLQAFLLEYANRVVTVAFKFVPLRFGVDELASGMIASLLGNAGAVGVTVAVIRKARVLCWSVVGLGLAAGRALVSRVRPKRQPALAERADGVTS